MSKDSKKDWERPWSTEEIVEHADNWNLACDAALLNTLKAFGDKIINKSEEVYQKLDNLCDNLEETSIRFDLARNEFNSLRNSQFMEFRVYEDDETLPAKDKEEEAENVVPKEETMEDLKKAVATGLEILDEFYEKVEVTVSDSEDDEVAPSYVYRRKDPYIDRRLPYVIGTDEWYKKWHVGLLESSDSENEKTPSEKFSDSEEEEPFQVKDHSDVSSISNISREQPVGVSSSNISANNDILPSTSESDSPGPSTPKVTNFAEQLAAKLGNVIRENRSLLEEPEVNRRPIQKKKSDYGALISDEPPPLDENTMRSDNTHGIFSGGKGLFDDEDEDDDVLWNPGKSNISTKNQLQTTVTREDFSKKDLFEEDSDDDIFSSARKVNTSHQIKQPYLPRKETAPIFSDEPPLLENEDQRERKKPPGGVSPFGNASIFQSKNIGDILKQRKSSSSEDTVSEIIKNEPIPPKESNITIAQTANSKDTISTVPREVNLPKHKQENGKNIFKDSNLEQETLSSPPETSDIFEKENYDRDSSTVNQNKSKNLFDDDIFEDSLFSNVDNKYSSLFSDDVPIEKPTRIIPQKTDDYTEGGLFENVSEIENEFDYSWKKSTKSKIDSLFDDEDDDFDLFKPKKLAEKPKQTMSEKYEINAEEKHDNKINESTKSKLSLFNDEEDEDDLFTEILKKDMKKSELIQKDSTCDIMEEKVKNTDQEIRASEKQSPFEETKVAEELPEEDAEVPKVLKEAPQTQSRGSISVPHVNFLDSVPPPEDGWDNSSDNAFDDLEPYGNDDFQSQPSSLFDSEPPSLFFNPSKKDDSTNRNDSFGQSQIPSRESTPDIFSDYSTIKRDSSKISEYPPPLPNVPDSFNPAHNNLDSTDEKKSGATGILKKVTDIDIPDENYETVGGGEPIDNSKKIEKPKKSVGFLDDMFGEDETDDLFKTQAADVSISEISENIIADKDSVDHLFLDKNLDRDEKSVVLDKVDEMQKNNISKIAEKFQQMASSNEDTPKNIAIPGKLTHKLQINVGALLPGGVPPTKNREPNPDENLLSKSLPASKFRPTIDEQRVSYLRKPAPVFRTVSESDASKNFPRLEKSVSFDDNTDIEVLRSITKDRPKIHVKRRPSSRRARQESLRKSVPDFGLLEDASEIEKKEQKTKDDSVIPDKIERTPIPSVVESLPKEVSKVVSSSNIFEDEDDEDLFKSIQKDVKSVNQAKIVSTKKKDLFTDDDDFFEPKTIQKKDPEKVSRHGSEAPIKVISEQKSLPTKKREKNDLFDSSDDSDDFLKATTEKRTNLPTISIIGKITQNKSKNLFDSSDEDGDFLESLGGAKSQEEKSSQKPSKPRGSSLFSDENDDEDIFGSSGPKNKTKHDIQPSVINKKAPKSSSLRKLGSIEGEEDPLSALLR